MSRQMICTVGTSVLTNRDDRPWAGWSPRKPRWDPSSASRANRHEIDDHHIRATP